MEDMEDMIENLISEYYDRKNKIAKHIETIEKSIKWAYDDEEESFEQGRLDKFHGEYSVYEKVINDLENLL